MKKHTTQKQSRSDRLFDADTKVGEAYDTVATLREEMEDELGYYQLANMPEGASKADAIQRCIDALEKVRKEMENLDLFCEVEFPSGF